MLRRPLATLFAVLSLTPLLSAQSDNSAGLDTSASPMRPFMERFTVDQENLFRFHELRIAPDRTARLHRFYADWLARLDHIDFDKLPDDGRIDYILFRNYLNRQQTHLDFNASLTARSATYLPFTSTIIGLEESRRNGVPMNASATAATLSQLAKDVDAVRKSTEAALQSPDTNRKVNANRAANEAAVLRDTLKRWYGFYNGYDPVFTWWATEPYKTADSALETYIAFLRERVVGLNPPTKSGDHPPVAIAKPGSAADIIGSPLGRDALLDELKFEMIAYTPEELIDIAYKELAWCENEMKRASREMGYGDDWKKALEKVKTMFVEPGKQPDLIRELEHEAEKFIDDHNLVTVPEVAHETWRMQMMTPERQLVNPFFTGGETISVSYPVADMTYEQKMMTMRGNNIPFSRATVFHELIPGHELQLYFADIYRPYRREIGSTPFLVEGWALYWELLFWDMKFQKTPEDRVGALFWHMHRCARIIFSLSFHLGKMNPEECVNFLVDRVGHERENAIGEVRRSFAGDYSPLYQAAYLLGGMQLYSLHQELVKSGKMTNVEFHDAILRENEMPIELIRASLMHQKLNRDFRPSWRFYGDGSRFHPAQ